LLGSSTGLGAPAFDLTGGFIGVVAMRSTAPPANGPVASLMAEFSGTDAAGMTPVVVPAEDIRAAARNVR
jgi:hypothetical protein